MRNVDVDRSLTDSWTGFTKFNRTKNFPKEKCGPGSDLPRFKQQPGLIVCGLKLALACQKQLEKRTGKNGLQKNQSSTTLENREHSLHRSGRGEREETINNARKSWKFPWRPLCLARWEQREAQSRWRTLQARLEKLPAWNLGKVKSKKEAHSVEAQREKESPLCHTDGHLSSQNSELEPKYQKYQGRVALRGDIVKDDSGAHAVFTEQGSSASQMTAAKVMDVICKTCQIVQDKLAMQFCAPKFLKNPKVTVSTYFWKRLPQHKWPKSWSNIQDPVVPLERNLYGHPLAGLWWERQFEEVLMGV